MKKPILILAVLFAVFTMCAGAMASDAYIDDESGIVVARGEATMSSGESYEVARMRAVDNARNNMILLVEKQYLDLDSITVGQYLTRHADKRAVVDRYISTARVFNETQENSVVKVTLLLAYYGLDGYQAMIAEITGKEMPANPADSRNMDVAAKAPDLISVMIATPYPGTELFDIMRAQGLAADIPWSAYAQSFTAESFSRTQTLSPQRLKYYQNWLLRKFYLRPGYIAQRLARMENPRDLQYWARAGMGFIRHITQK